MIRYIILAIVAYCVYKVVFDFLVPLFRVTRRMKRQVREFQQRANEDFQHAQTDNFPRQEKETEKAGEYIDFEEIKEK
jgi:hypothetical protein